MPRKFLNGVEQLWVATFTFPGYLAVRTGQIRWPNITGRTLTVKGVRMFCATAPTGASVIVDLNKNGTTMYTTQANRPTIAISGTSVTATLPDVTSVSDGDLLTMDVDQIGSTVLGKDLTLAVLLGG